MRAALAAALLALLFLGGCRPVEIVYDGYQYHPPGFSSTRPDRPGNEPVPEARGEARIDAPQDDPPPEPETTFVPPIRFTPAVDGE